MDLKKERQRVVQEWEKALEARRQKRVQLGIEARKPVFDPTYSSVKVKELQEEVNKLDDRVNELSLQLEGLDLELKTGR